jgi:CHAT domain-containing protein
MAGEGTGTYDEAGLILTRRSAEPDNDGFLAASEVATLHLDADWIILSACNTATAAQGERDVSSLSRAFLYAGARSLLISHWYVGSDASRRLVEDTLSWPNAIAQPAVALQQAMISLRDETFSDYAHPYYWSPFSLFGGTTP